MSVRYACSVIAAGVLASATAFAQADTQSSARGPAQVAAEKGTPITLVGCIQRESDYRREHNIGRGGAAGMGLGLGNEFVLINASKKTEGGAPAGAAAGIDCSKAGTGEAYELTGSREGELERFVGRPIEVVGTLKPAETEQGTVGTTGSTAPKPTGGFDPLKQDLKLHEVNVTSFSEVSANAPQPGTTAEPPTGTTAEPPKTTEPPQSQSTAAPSEAQSGTGTREQAKQPEPATGQAGTQEQLPRTASPLPLAGVIGLLSLTGAWGLRARRAGRHGA